MTDAQDIVGRPSFPLKDNDPPSHMWTIAAMLRRRHGQAVIAEWLEKYAEEFHAQSDRIKELEGVLGDAPCPRPANVRPDDETVRTCIDSGFGGGCQFCGALNTSPPIGKENEGNRT